MVHPEADTSPTELGSLVGGAYATRRSDPVVEIAHERRPDQDDWDMRLDLE